MSTLRFLYEIVLVWAAMLATYLAFKASNQFEAAVYLSVIFAAIVCFAVEQEEKGKE